MPTTTSVEAVLARLRRKKLIRTWSVDADTGRHTITVGSGTIRPLTNLTEPEVSALADQLRRDTVTIAGAGYPVGHRTTRYRLTDGRFADRNESQTDRYLPQYPYTVFLPGGSTSGSAEVHFVARTLNDALALAGLKRVRGRCRNCDTLRPLHVDGWRADPNIPCPACESPPTADPLIIPCRWCPLDIEKHDHGFGMLYTAWRHIDGTTTCNRDARPGSFDIRPTAQPR